MPNFQKVAAKKALATTSLQSKSVKSTKRAIKDASKKANFLKSFLLRLLVKRIPRRRPLLVKKGKDHVMERNDSDEDSLDLDNMEEMREAMAKYKRKTEPGNLFLSACLQALLMLQKVESSISVASQSPAKFSMQKVPSSGG